MLDHEIIGKFKEFQKITGKYSNLNIERVIFENINLSNKKYFFITMGQSPEGKYLNKISNGLPFYQGKTDFGKYYLKETTTWTLKSKKEAKINDILISLRAPAGAVNLANINLSIGRGLASIRCLKNVLNMYVFYYLKNNEYKINIENDNGGIFSSMNKDYLYDLNIPVPKKLNEKYSSYDIQKAIVDFLEFWKIENSDKLKLKIEKLKPTYELLKKIIIPNIFKKDKVIEEKFNLFAKIKGYDLKFKDIYFEKKFLKDLVSQPIKGGGTPDTKINKYWIKEFGLVDNENYFGWRNIEKKLFEEKYITEYSKVITQAGLKNSSSWLVPTNSILIAIASASKGLIVINDKPMCTNQNILGVTINTENYTDYVYYNLKNIYLTIDGKKDFGNLTKGSEENREINIPRNFNDYKSIEIQKILVDFLEVIFENIDNKLDNFKKISDLLEKLDATFLCRTFNNIDWSNNG